MFKKILFRNKRLIFVLILFLISFIFFSFRFRPIVKSISISTAKVFASEAVNEAILQELSENKKAYEEITKVEKLQNGELSAIFSDMETINKLKSKVAILVQSKFSEFKNRKLKIPLGTLTGIEMFSGIGPEIPMKISVGGNVTTDFKTFFKDAGINQTMYQIYLCLSTRISVSVPGCRACDNFDTKVLISQLVVLGGVPKVYSSKAEPVSVNSSEIE